jgi:lysozyme
MKKSPIPKPTKVSKPDTLSFDEIYQWIRAQEGPPSFTKVPDGRTKDGRQLFSIGLGHQIQPNEIELMNKTLTEEEVLQIFEKDVEEIRQSMNKVIKVPINKNQQLALFSLRYNIGSGNFNSSTLLKVLNSGDYTGTALRFAEWRIFEGKVNRGLVARRERERILFSKPV